MAPAAQGCPEKDYFFPWWPVIVVRFVPSSPTPSHAVAGSLISSETARTTALPLSIDFACHPGQKNGG